MGDGLDEAAAFLLAMRNDAADPSMAGFNLPGQILQLDDFKKAVNENGVKRFGSGWTWLVHDGTGLSLYSTPNQDSRTVTVSDHPTR